VNLVLACLNPSLLDASARDALTALSSPHELAVTELERRSGMSSTSANSIEGKRWRS
jgi:hypothetical protein